VCRRRAPPVPLLAGGKGALPADSHGAPWNGTYVHSSGYLLVRGGVHQVAYARALENLTGADMTALFPSPRIATDKIPECKPHLERGEHLKLYRFSPDDYKEIVAVFNGKHPETGEDLEVVDQPPEGFPPNDLPAQTDVFAPDYAPEEIKEIPQKLRKKAGLPDEPLAVVANN
jgi:Mn-containing catalase